MKKLLIGAIGAVFIAATTAGVIIYSGAIDVAADAPHSAPVYQLLEFAREQSIARRANDVPPSDLTSKERIRRGAGNYDAMCAGCHLIPGQTTSEIRKGLYPSPPDLTQASAKIDPARQFWIIKHGIKSTGMAAWAEGGMEDSAIWDLVALVQQLPTLSADQYRQTVALSDGHSHGGMEHDHTEEPGHEHEHHSHDHGHQHEAHSH